MEQWSWLKADSYCLGSALPYGQPLTGRGDLLSTSGRLAELRRSTAWVDPGVHLWNRSVQENLVYGADERPQRSLARVIDQAELVSVLRKLPDGAETIVGEGGGLLSGGEGQRVRLARAILPLDVRLVILDEPFRGLARTTRETLLRRARSLWPTATLLYITHDIAETQAFARVLVMEHGRIVEAGAPADLRAQANSRYKTMLEAETAIWRTCGIATVGVGCAWRMVC